MKISIEIMAKSLVSKRSFTLLKDVVNFLESKDWTKLNEFNINLKTKKFYLDVNSLTPNDMPKYDTQLKIKKDARVDGERIIFLHYFLIKLNRLTQNDMIKICELFLTEIK